MRGGPNSAYIYSSAMPSMDDPDNSQTLSSETANAAAPSRLIEMLWRAREDLVRPLADDELFDALFRAASQLVRPDAFLFALYDEDSRTVEVLRQVEYGRSLPGGTFPLGQGPTSQAITTRRPRLIREWSGTPPFTLQFLSDRIQCPSLH